MMLSRIPVVILAAAIGWITGVRAPRAQTFGDAAFAGKGRATLTITRVGAEVEAEPEPVEVYARMTFGTELSGFQEGLYVRSSFAMPGVDGAKGLTTVLVVDVDLSNGRRSWQPEVVGLSESAASGSRDGVSVRARLYEVDDGETGFDARPRAGLLDLEASVVTRSAAGFRLRGWLALLDAGPDGLDDTSDDLAFDIELTLESVPTPDALAGQGSAPLPRPVGGVCDPSVCWVDAGYYDAFYGYGCSDAVVDDGSTSDGCGGEPDYDDYDDDADSGNTDSGAACEGDSSTGYDDNGNPTSDSGDSGDVACEGDDVEADSSGGCDSADSGSGCEGTEADGACGGSDAGSGCEGDAMPGGSGGAGPEAGPPTTPLRRADVSWVGVLMIGLAMALQRLAKR